MRTTPLFLARRAAALSLLALGACGGFGSDANIGGTLAGLATGSTVVLSNNGTDNLSLVANGSFVFAKQVAAGSDYSVAVVTQPLGQTCTVGNATGTVNAAGSDIDKITVSCVVTSSVIAQVTGLPADTTVTLTDGVTPLVFAKNSSAAFPGLVAPGKPYTVTVVSSTDKVTCTPKSTTGDIPATGIATVIVTCAATA